MPRGYSISARENELVPVCSPSPFLPSSSSPSTTISTRLHRQKGELRRSQLAFVVVPVGRPGVASTPSLGAKPITFNSVIRPPASSLPRSCFFLKGWADEMRRVSGRGSRRRRQARPRGVAHPRLVPKGADVLPAATADYWSSSLAWTGAVAGITHGGGGFPVRP